MARPVIIIGAGGHAQVVGATLVAAGMSVAGYYDDDAGKWGTRIDGVEVIGPSGAAVDASGSPGAIIGVGDNHTRKRIAETLRLDWVSVVHPFSWIAPGVTIGVGTVVFAGCIVQPGASIGDHVILNTKSSVDHGASVGDYSHIAMAHVAGDAVVEVGGFLGLSSVVLPGLRVGAWAVVGAGSLVRRDVAPEITVVGSPARELPIPRRTLAPPTEDFGR